MTQDNQNSQPSSPEPEANQLESTFERVTQPEPKNQPIWKAKTIQLLRGTIGVLETTVQKLETEPVETLETEPVETRNTKSLHWWSAVLARIRSLLPANLSAKLSDTALTGVIAAIAILLVWTTSNIFGGKQSEVVNIPPTLEAPQPTIVISPAVEAPPTPTVAVETPPPTVEETPPTVAVETPPPTVEETPPTVAVETPPPEPTPTPTPTIILTPEQTLIAAIENQVAQVSDRFASGLIKSIQANFRSSSLIIKINDNWYTLEQSQQDKLAADMLQRSKELDFSHLDIIDSRNGLVARNPVVGEEMIIFQRRTLTVPSPQSL